MNWNTLFAGLVGANELAFALTALLLLNRRIADAATRAAVLQHFIGISGHHRDMQAAPVPVTLPAATRRRP